MAKVKIYSTPTCTTCKSTKAFLSENNIKFEDVNVAEDQKAAQEMMQKSGQMSVPVIDVDGQVVLGFDKAKLKKLLNIAG